ncbi:lmo0937 family membrane protein [Simiduia sp. 21SJ11W-1]|nr:lmo0937 family membrane protein [Simiduia sp. 21SJ11W-1]UTA48931.1 lmo0937 family membrane protein [Simiduia sp. 21SJ11W-1]
MQDILVFTLLFIWALGLVFSYTVGGYIHLLLLVVIVVLAKKAIDNRGV